ncbi:hypothetical protein LMG24238_07110 [Paraburkholderia sediminicola]|uniref:Uncharacterized protein n=1 Tax=Paraburkholderia sediminicola TaxID=458836 RepID=A0A6J5CU00_9BURK|nr:hypothetical protein LMG24238_07110 [Paraburkholderia sediminicola]
MPRLVVRLHLSLTGRLLVCQTLLLSLLRRLRCGPCFFRTLLLRPMVSFPSLAIRFHLSLTGRLILRQTFLLGLLRLFRTLLLCPMVSFPSLAIRFHLSLTGRLLLRQTFLLGVPCQAIRFRLALLLLRLGCVVCCLTPSVAGAPGKVVDQRNLAAVGQICVVCGRIVKIGIDPGVLSSGFLFLRREILRFIQSAVFSTADDASETFQVDMRVRTPQRDIRTIHLHCQTTLARCDATGAVDAQPMLRTFEHDPIRVHAT